MTTREVHDAYCPAGSACTDVECGFLPVMTVQAPARRLVALGRLQGRRMDVLYQAPKTAPGSYKFA